MRQPLPEKKPGDRLLAKDINQLTEATKVFSNESGPGFHGSFRAAPMVAASRREPWIYKTPVGGIAGRSGVRCGSANCRAYYINDSDDLIEVLSRSGASLAVPIKNPFATAIAGDTYITAKYIRGVLVIDAEDCG